MTRLRDCFWLDLPATRSVMQALEVAGGQDCARFVGGCVRDAVLGIPSDDVDIATILLPEAVVTALEIAGLKAVPTGMAHGTVTAISERRPYEITTLRRDVSTDGRNATVAFSDDWIEDAARRDFRLNALYADAGGELFDPTGEGLADALAGRIVFVGDPVTRIREDYLRILRFFRFYAWYGRGVPDAAGLAACGAERGGMSRLSAERVQKELLKLLAAPDPLPALRAMARTGVLAQILPEAQLTPAFGAMVEAGGGLSHRLMVLLPNDAQAAREVGRRLRLSNAMTHRLAAAAEVELDANLSGPELHVLLYRHGHEAVEDQLLRHQAEEPDRADRYGELRHDATLWDIPRMPVTGRNVTRLGIPPGPDVGAILKAFEQAWMAADFPPTGHEALLADVMRAWPA